ncbi:hypothetical protein ACGFW5_26950 [Streptomyces sp. NPDC048416]|uniref:hypothetical protein n=1 Tax=Streptomyces sp. NPDC048416 TaxID=3365546 RepID=UPI003722640A
MAPRIGAGLWFCSSAAPERRIRRDGLVKLIEFVELVEFVEKRPSRSRKKQGVGTLMTLTVTGTARVQQFIVRTSVVSG